MKKYVAPLVLLSVSIASLTAAPIVFHANLNGPSESPPNASTATGFALVTIDSVAHTMNVISGFSGLMDVTTAAHIHVINGPGDTDTSDTLGPVATTTPAFPDFPIGVTLGSYVHDFDTLQASTYRAQFVTDSGSISAAESELFAAIGSGRAYFNIHSEAFPGGEIRGFLTEIPEPASFGFSAIGLAGLTLGRLLHAKVRRR